MSAQLAPTYGLSLSPIRLIFQQKPVTPVRFSLVSPGCIVCSNWAQIERGMSGKSRRRIGSSNGTIFLSPAPAYGKITKTDLPTIKQRRPHISQISAGAYHQQYDGQET